MAQITLNSTGVASNGALVLQSNGTTTAVTISTAQVATLEKDAVVNGLTVGRGAGAVATNTAVGASALAANQAGGTNNTAIGNAALDANTTGDANTAVGDDALGSNTTASNNTAVGYQAGYSQTTADGNVLIGISAGYGLTTGNLNTFVGASCGVSMSTGTKNTIIGRFSGNQGGLDIRTASNYIVLSDGDGNPWVYHNSSIGLNIRGYDAADTSGINFRNSSTTKYWGIATNSSDFFISNGTFSNYVVLSGQSFTAWTFSSDRRIKTDIVDIEYGLDAVMAMKPRKYKMLSSGETSIGFVAQELKNIVPEAVTGEEIEYLDTDTQQEKAAKTMGVSRDLLIPVLVKAIQELKAEIDALKGTA
jgi:hypothetical protein